MESVYRGKSDSQRVSIYGMFPYTPIFAVAPITHGDGSPIVLYGPSDHLRSLYPHMLNVVKKSEVDPRGYIGTWVSLQKFPDRLEAFYQFGQSVSDQIVLLEHKLRTDLAFIANLRLSDVAILEVMYGDRSIVKAHVLLPEELVGENGTILLVPPRVLP